MQLTRSATCLGSICSEDILRTLHLCPREDMLTPKSYRPLGCGFVGVMPALNFIMTTEENGPLILSTWKLIVWALGLCFFGVVIAVPLRRQVIIRERLKFPSGTATALMIGVLHGRPQDNGLTKVESGMDIFQRRSQDVNRSVSNIAGIPPQKAGPQQIPANTKSAEEQDDQDEWKAKIRQLIYAFGISAAYVGFSGCCIVSYNCTDLIRHFSRISFRRSIVFPSLDYSWPKSGSGRSIHHPLMLVKVSLWDQPLPYICFLELS